VHALGNARYPVQRLLAGKGNWAMPVPDNLGPLRNRTLLHLQCHIGLDSMRWARQGARVTGVDFSPTAIAEARKLSTASRIPAEFIESDIYALPRILRRHFDVVVSTYGVTCWLPDLRRWGRIIAGLLKPGGFFYLAEIHPFFNTLEFDGPGGRPRLANSYFFRGAERYVIRRGTYAAPKARTGHKVEYGWQHSIDETVSALRNAGLVLDFLHEFPYAYCELTSWTHRRLMRKGRRGFWHFRSGDRIPLMFSLKARKAR